MKEQHKEQPKEGSDGECIGLAQESGHGVWEQRYDPDGNLFWTNHTLKTTAWEPPPGSTRLVQQPDSQPAPPDFPHPDLLIAGCIVCQYNVPHRLCKEPTSRTRVEKSEEACIEPTSRTLEEKSEEANEIPDETSQRCDMIILVVTYMLVAYLCRPDSALIAYLWYEGHISLDYHRMHDFGSEKYFLFFLFLREMVNLYHKVVLMIRCIQMKICDEFNCEKLVLEGEGDFCHDHSGPDAEGICEAMAQESQQYV